MTRDYVYPWKNVWFRRSAIPRSRRPTPPRGSGNDIDAATANLFAMHNRMHDWSYHLGFTERALERPVRLRPPRAAAGPAGTQTVNGDPRASATSQAGGLSGGSPNYVGRDNANMVTLPGRPLSPITNMYLWQPLAGAFYAPCVDGDYDMPVIGHEYAHMIENRMIGKGNRRARATTPARWASRTAT